jgi:hypothetical protein
MNNTLHTPAPWRIEPEEHAAVILCDAFVVADVYYEAGVSAGASTKEEALANAHLISAAPDLLEALERAENALNWFINDEGECDIEALDTARAAIAKAKGEA